MWRLVWIRTSSHFNSPFMKYGNSHSSCLIPIDDSHYRLQVITPFPSPKICGGELCVGCQPSFGSYWTLFSSLFPVLFWISPARLLILITLFPSPTNEITLSFEISSVNGASFSTLRYLCSYILDFILPSRHQQVGHLLFSFSAFSANSSKI
ncbi:hypothetical protein CPB84DRAFT_1040015 [Gymnopilus junonius]|uniref:Uncharacterized protein n=1 Tax=Gymnopilus junonius TaxID=109634 RepID=A0A9P5NQ81_GYMJU|nr:hypothetical protein CPB84DRAFT_1040015 [Gymnopilus junonius]